MPNNLKSIAGTAIILAMLTVTSVQARQPDADAPKNERGAAQSASKTQTQTPCFWLVLGVGY